MQAVDSKVFTLFMCAIHGHHEISHSCNWLFSQLQLAVCTHCLYTKNHNVRYGYPRWGPVTCTWCFSEGPHGLPKWNSFNLERSFVKFWYSILIWRIWVRQVRVGPVVASVLPSTAFMSERRPCPCGITVNLREKGRSFAFLHVLFSSRPTMVLCWCVHWCFLASVFLQHSNSTFIN